MKHLAPHELVDVVEGATDERRAAHLATCDRCRREVEALTAVLAHAREAEAPEPSPLFWDRFSARVREAVADEPAPPSLRYRLWRPAYALAAALALAMIVAGAALWREIPGGAPAPGLAGQVEEAAEPALDLGAVPGDETWEIVVAVASDMAWDEAEEAGFAVAPGAADRGVLALTTEERVELARLLEAELPATKS